MRIGLTGGIASGKTVVARLLSERGATVIDADVVAREVVEPGTPGLAAITRRFGHAVLTANGELNRAALGAIVFADPEARKDLEAIVHPAVRRRAAELEAHAEAGSVIVHVIPLLVETGQQDSFDRVVVVDVPPDVQRARLMERSALSEVEADARIAAQAGRDERLSAADHVIDNSGSLDQLSAQVAALWERFSQG